MFDAMQPDIWGEECNAWGEGSNLFMTVTSASLHWHQKATVAVPKTAASKVLVRVRLWHKDRRCLIVMGAHGTLEEVDGASARERLEALFR